MKQEQESTAFRVETNEQREMVMEDSQFWLKVEIIGGAFFTVWGVILVLGSRYNFGIVYMGLGLFMVVLGVLFAIDYRYRCVLWHLDRAGMLGKVKK